jgi:hypothetical protein
MSMNLTLFNRRQMLKASGTLAMGAVASSSASPVQEEAGVTNLPPIHILSRCVAIDDVCAWPNLTLMPDGAIVSTIYNHPSHLMGEGDVECWASTDGGKFWTRLGVAAPHEPRTARANVASGVAHNGDLIVLCSGWGYAPGFRDRRLPPWVCRSGDGGRTWSVDKSKAAITFPEGATYDDRGGRMIKPFGDIVQLPNRKLAASFYHDRGTVWIHFSHDDGRSWTETALLCRDHRGETAVLRLRADRWLAAARTEGGDDGKPPERGLELFVCNNEGRTWTAEGPLTKPLEHPGHLLRLQDGRVLLTFGMRDVYGIGIRESADEGRTWQPPRLLVSMASSPQSRPGGTSVNWKPTADLGYPATVQLPDGTLVTAYYTQGIEQHQHYHMGVIRWKLGE